MGGWGVVENQDGRGARITALWLRYVKSSVEKKLWGGRIWVNHSGIAAVGFRGDNGVGEGVGGRKIRV